MAEWDDKTGKVRPTWTVRFSPWWIFVGCGIAGVVCAAVLFFTVLTGPGLGQLNDANSVVRGGLLLVGMSFGIFILLGPTLAWGLGFMLRNNTNQGMHIAAFALLGLFVGFMIGNLAGIGSLIAPAAGIGAAAGRWAISGQTKI